MKTYPAVLVSKNLFPIATNFVTPVDVQALTVKRHRKVIIGETREAVEHALKERRGIINALKRQRRERRAA